MSILLRLKHAVCPDCHEEQAIDEDKEKCWVCTEHDKEQEEKEK